MSFFAKLKRRNVAARWVSAAGFDRRVRMKPAPMAIKTSAHSLHPMPISVKKNIQTRLTAIN